MNEFDRDKEAPEPFTYDPSFVASDEFSEGWPELIDRYIECRIDGLSREESIMDALDMIKQGARLHNCKELALAAEASPRYKQTFKARLKAVKPETMWDINRAVSELLKLVLNENVRDTTRLSAIRELNVIFGITVVEDGLTKAGMSLADFYKLEGDLKQRVDGAAKVH